jgi:hypothetical protein
MTTFTLPPQYDSSYTAWLAGFQYSVTAALSNEQRRELLDFAAEPHDELTLWQNIGRDYINGIWTILGARMGVYMTLITPTWDYLQANDTTALAALFATIKDADPELIAARVAEDLVNQLNLPIVMLNANESAFLRYYLELTQK